jgi:peptide/nickel transport system permease protein
MPSYSIGLFARQRALVFGTAAIVAMLLAAFFAPLPYDPVRPSAEILSPPSLEHPFGTDRSGFDVMSRTIVSAGRDLPLALAGTLVSVLIGVPLGLVASGKGKSGERMMRALDAFQAFPLLVLAIAVVTLTGNRLENVIFAIAIINVPRFMRLVRSEVLPMRESRFVEAALAIGASPTRMMFRHLLPNVTSIILVQCSLSVANAIVVIASLSFLGIGVSPPEATWGAMIQSGAPNMSTGQWWVVAFPGLAVFLAVACLNMIADGLSDVTRMVTHA